MRRSILVFASVLAVVPLLVALTGWNGRAASIGERRRFAEQPLLRAFFAARR